MNNLQVLVRCYDKVAQNSGFRCPPLTSPLGYKQTSSRPKSTSALPPKPDIPAQMYGSGPIRSGLWPSSVHPH